MYRIENVLSEKEAAASLDKHNLAQQRRRCTWAESNLFGSSFEPLEHGGWINAGTRTNALKRGSKIKNNKSIAYLKFQNKEPARCGQDSLPTWKPR